MRAGPQVVHVAGPDEYRRTASRGNAREQGNTACVRSDGRRAWGIAVGPDLRRARVIGGANDPCLAAT